MNIDKKQMNIAVNHQYFISSLIDLLTLLKNKSESLNIKNTMHTKLQKSCSDLINIFSNPTSDFDKGKFIKKIYKTLSTNLNKLYPDFDNSLFLLTNEKNAIITVIAGVDISLIIPHLNDVELKTLWSHLYIIFIAVVGMISEVNTNDTLTKINELIPKLKEKISSFGIISFDKIINPFFGLLQNSSNIDINSIVENAKSGKTTDASPLNADDLMNSVVNNITSSMGMDKIGDINSLVNSLKDINDADMHTAINNITKLIGVENDKDITDVCTSLMTDILSDLKKNPNGGLGGILKTAKSVTEKMGKSIDPKKMEKTAKTMTAFLASGSDKLKNLKDEHGNQIGQNILSAMQNPAQLANLLNKTKK